jgi:type IV secretion system protein VirB10
MSDTGNASPSQVAPETLELRARPQPVTRVNRKVLIGGAAVGLILISGLVLVALKPPTWRVANPQELINVERKPVTDGLSKLPVSYDSLPAAKTDRAPKLPTGIPRLVEPSVSDTLNDPARFEKARLDRMAGQARESQVFFRLQLKSPPSRDATAQNDAHSELNAQPVSNAAVIPAPNTTLRAGDRARALDPENLAPIGTDATEPTRKLAFLQAGPKKDIYNPHALETPASRYQLMAGTIISASLISGLNSDLPGFVIAQVTENVYDTVSGKYLLIPQGSRLIGKYDNVVAFGQERALVVWQRIILPDGSSVLIDNLPATDTAGYAGLADDVDLHTWTLLKGVALATVLGVGSELAFGINDSDLVRALQQSTQSTTNRAGQRLVERYLNVQPTITVRPGWPLRVIVHKDIVLRPYPTTAAK